VLARVLAQGHRVGENVVTDLGHHRDPSGDLPGNELVDPLSLLERQRPELAHHAAAEDSVDPESVDVVLDRCLQRLLVDVGATGRERRGNSDPDALHALAGKGLGGAGLPRVHSPAYSGRR